MLDFIHHYANGFVALPILDSIQRLRLNDNDFNKNMNKGVIHILLNRLSFLDLPAGEQEIKLPFDVRTVYSYDFNKALHHNLANQNYAHWIDSIEKFQFTDERWQSYCIGALLILVLNALDLTRLSKENFIVQCQSFSDETRVILMRHLYLAGMIKSPNEVELTDVGEFIINKASRFGVVVSYIPLLCRLDEMLSGSVSDVLGIVNTKEKHIDRNLNVVASGLWHQKYFDVLEKKVIDIFNTDDLNHQPKIIADCGCGDGSLLKRLYNAIVFKTKRGQQLKQYPLRLLALDFNEESLIAAQKTLVGLPVDCLQVDISNPAAMLNEFAKIAVDPKEILHVRSFVDHERNIETIDVTENEQPGDLLAIDDRGNTIPTRKIIDSLILHLERWKNILGNHGLLLLEVHAISAHDTKIFFNQSESFYFDFTQALSKQYLVRAEQFHLAAANAGLLLAKQGLAVFPQVFPFKRITLCHFFAEDFVIRLANEKDLPALMHLEKSCWLPDLQLPALRLKKRLRQFPEGQFILSRQDKIIGCLYTQRITDIELLRTTSFADIEKLHNNNGTHLQLLSINIDPAYQHEGLGDKLRNFILHHSRLMSGVMSVTGVTRCSKYDGSSEYQQAALKDPTVRFHMNGGANILGFINDYRPEDTQNAGTGILIEYLLEDKINTLSNLTIHKATTEEKKHLFHKIINDIYNKKKLTYNPDLPLRDGGFDSLELMELRYTLECNFHCNLDPAFFFKHPTPQSMLEAIFLSNVGKNSRAAEKTSVKNKKTPKRVSKHDQYIAIIGISCEFPEITNLDDFWQYLVQGKSIKPNDPRWSFDLNGNSDTNNSITRVGLLSRFAYFDETFFHVSPREAELMDPQQRRLLMHTWHALEHAGIAPGELKGRRVGVYIGCCADDFKQVVKAVPAEDLGYYASGVSNSMLAGRLAYFFDWQGPAMVVDTACSSSMVALSLAKQALDLNECEFAVVAGVNLLLDSKLSMSYAHAGMLSPTGQCHTFDAAADGYLRSEGIAVCILTKHANATQRNCRIWGTIESVAVNQDGLSNGITAPNPKAQQLLIEQALTKACLKPSMIDFIEAHGTGTPLGDPIEVSAITAVLEEERREAPCILTAVKSNIGHTEGAAGIAGLIKVLLALQNEQIPPVANFAELNPDIQLAQNILTIPKTPVSWPAGKKLRTAGISSFGFSGTNVHAIISDRGCNAPVPPLQAVNEQYHVICLSANNIESLKQQINVVTDFCRLQKFNLDDLAYTTAIRRAHFPYRLAVVVKTPAEICKQLEKISHDNKFDVPAKLPRIGFLFTGQGSQYPRMGIEYYQRFPVFKAWIDKFEVIYHELSGVSLVDILWGEKQDLIHQTQYTQPCLYCYQYALASLWLSLGIQPTVMLGHSVGEYAAAAIAGVMQPEDALRLIYARGSLMVEHCSPGKMLAVFADEAYIHSQIQSFKQVSIAAMNAPNQCVISGDNEQIDLLAEKLTKQSIRVIPLTVSHGFHSPTMQPMLDSFKKQAELLCYEKSAIDMVSTVSAYKGKNPFADAEYWVTHVSSPVNFSQAIAKAKDLDVDIFIEIGPQPILTGLAEQNRSQNEYCRYFPSHKAGDLNLFNFHQTLAYCYRQGTTIQWQSIFPAPGLWLDFPQYQFISHDYTPVIKQQALYPVHDKIDVTTPQYSLLKQHSILGQPLLPAAFYLAWVINQTFQKNNNNTLYVEHCIFEQKYFLMQSPRPISIQTDADLSFFAVKFITENALQNSVSLCVIKGSYNQEVELSDEQGLAAIATWIKLTNSDVYNHFSHCGYHYNSVFCSLDEIYITPDFLLAKATLLISENLNYPMRMTVGLDGALQLLLLLAQKSRKTDGEIFYPYSCQQSWFSPQCLSATAALVKITDADNDYFQGEIFLYTQTHLLCAKLNIRFQRRAVQYFSQPQWIEQPIKNDQYFHERRVGILVNELKQSEVYLKCLGIARADIISIEAFVNNQNKYDQIVYIPAAKNYSVLAEALKICQVLQSYTGKLEFIAVIKDTDPCVAQGLVGFLKSAALEMSNKVRTRIISIDAFEPGLLTSEINSVESVDTWVTYQNKIRKVLELKTLALSLNESTINNQSGTILITGGLGQLGLLTAQVLIEQGYKHIVLMGRNNPNPSANHLINEWRNQGITITAYQCDITDKKSLYRYVEAIESTGHPLTGIIHSAGIVRDAGLMNQTSQTLGAVWDTKVTAAQYLHEFTEKKKLKFFICYSSITALIGQAGQTNYTAANLALEALMVLRQSQGLPGLCVAWGPWSIGMTQSINPAVHLHAELSQFEYISQSQGKKLIQVLLTQIEKIPLPVIYVTHQDWQTLVHERNQRGRSLYFILPSLNIPVAMIPNNKIDWRLLTRDEMIKRITGIVAKVLRINDSSAIQLTTPLKNYGLESLSATEIRNVLAEDINVSLPITLLFDYPTIQKLTTFISEEILANKENISLSTEKTVLSNVGKIAIIGYSCRFPGNADTPTDFWKLLEEGSSGIVEMSQQRWDMQAYYDETKLIPGKMNIRHFGLLRGVDLFDADFFNVTPKEAIYLDPQQRLLLESTWETLERACIPPSHLQGSNTGVFLGIMNHDYVHLNHADLLGDKAKHSAYFASGEAFSAAVGRLAYFFDLNGPAMAVDTACSSSLVALHLACQSLKSGESEQAIVAGINLILSPEVTVECANANMLSPSGKCYTFDRQADGYVRAEGVGVVLLKPYEKAIADGNLIFGIIRSTTVNQDGRSQGLTAPNGVAQQKLLRQALTQAKFLPEQISYIEAHGTGTPLGDPIEISALQAVYAINRDESKPLHIGSVKTNIGHMESAAGMAGLIKILLMFEHKQIPAHLNLKQMNENIKLANGVHINSLLQKWNAETEPRCAAISSFGFSGTNSHVILEEPPPLPVSTFTPISDKTPALLFVFSAKQPAALKLLLKKYLSFFKQYQHYDLADVSYTLLKGRDHFAVRRAVLAHDYTGLCQSLQQEIDNFDYSPSYSPDQFQHRYWRGEELSWREILGNGSFKFVQLPTMAFIRKSYWVNEQLPDQDKVSEKSIYALEWEPIKFNHTADKIFSDYCWLKTSHLEKTFVLGKNQTLILDAQEDIKPEMLPVYLKHLLLFLKHLIELRLPSLEIILVTQFAYFTPMSASKNKLSIHAQSLIAMLRVLSLEQPSFKINVIDSDVPLTLSNFQRYHNRSRAVFEVNMWRDGGCYIERLVPIKKINNRIVDIDPQSFYLITGGTSGLGLLTAEVLVEAGARHVILASRSGVKSAKDGERIKKLVDEGINIQIARFDLTDKEAVIKEIHYFKEQRPIKGIIHSAGTVNDALIRNQTLEQFEQVLFPKLKGAWNLHEAIKDQGLDFFILYSSVTSVIGNMGQVNYAAANAYLDALAYYRRCNGLPAVVVNWGAWRNIGAAADQTIESLLQQQGIGLIEQEPGKTIIHSAWQTDMVQLVYAPIDWEKLSAQRSAQSLWEHLIQPVNRVEHTKELFSFVASDFIKEFQDNDRQKQQSLIETVIVEELMRVSGLSKDSIDLRMGFVEMGIGSLMSIEMHKNLQQRLGIHLSVTLLFDYPTIEKLSTYLQQYIEKFHDVKVDDMSDNQAIKMLEEVLR